MKTLHLIDSLGPGGAERSLAEIVRELKANGYQPTVAYFEVAENNISKSFADTGIPTVQITASSWSGRIRAVRSLLSEMRPAILHTTLFNADVVGRLAALGREVTVLTSLVNTSYEPIRYSDRRVRRHRLRTAQALDAATARLRGDIFHAITEAVAKSAIFRLRLRPESVIVIPRGRERDRLGHPSAARRRRVRAELGIPDEEFVVLHVGREDHQKAHVDVIRGFLGALSERSDLHLVLAGRRGNASAEIDALMSGSAATQRIQRLGHREDIGDLLSAADLFLFPSLYEGLGGAVLEAMAMEVAIVASDVPALREVLRGSAWFVPVHDPSAIARAILESSLDPIATRTRAAAARAWFDTEYAAPVVTERMLDLFARAGARGLRN